MIYHMADMRYKRADDSRVAYWCVQYVWSCPSRYFHKSVGSGFNFHICSSEYRDSTGSVRHLRKWFRYLSGVIGRIEFEHALRVFDFVRNFFLVRDIVFIFRLII